MELSPFFGSDAEKEQSTFALRKVTILKCLFRGRRNEEPHRVRRGCFNSAKSCLLLEKDCNAKDFSSHIMGLEQRSGDQEKYS